MRATRSTTIAVLLLGAVALSACTGSPGSAPASESPSSPTAPAGDGDAGAAATPSRLVTPLDQDALTAIFESTAEELGQPGAAMLLRTPEGGFTATCGTTTRGGSTPVSAEDHIRIGSNTKTWTGTVILQLVQEGRIALGDAVSTFRPDVPNGQNITIEQLLEMRSGLANYTDTYELNAGLDAEPQRVWKPEELLAMAFALPPTFAPGAAYQYSNTNTVLLGLIAEQIEGKPLAQIFHDRLFGPLGLTETSFPAIDDTDLPLPRADGYHWWTNVGTISSTKLPPDLLAQAQAGTFQPTDSTLDNPSWAWSAGAGISTLDDLATWVEALGGKGTPLLNPELQRSRLNSAQPVAADAPGAYGWGIAKMGSFYGHTGELPGYNSFMGYDPATDVTLVVWANLAPAANGKGPADVIAQALVKALYE